jgi:hypothetical protein
MQNELSKKIRISQRIILGLLYLVGVLTLAGCSGSGSDFSIQSGDPVVVVLLRDEEPGRYTLTYEGKDPAQIRFLQTMIAGEILHVDVARVILHSGDNAVQLVNNNVPEGQEFHIMPGDNLEIEVVFSGQTLGFNYIHGFRINYDAGGENFTVDVVDPKSPEYQFLIDVE